MSKCECQWLSWIPRCYGHCKSQQQVQLPDRWRTEVSHIAEKDRIARWGTETKPEVVELPIAKVAEDTMIRPKVEVDVSYAKVIEVVQCKSAAQVFMEEKAQKIKTKQKMKAKLALQKALVMFLKNLYVHSHQASATRDVYLCNIYDTRR